MAMPARQIQFENLPILHTDNVPRRRRRTQPTWLQTIPVGLFMFALVSLILWL